jgi:NitT/TauT family transport system ATP-binding protein
MELRLHGISKRFGETVVFDRFTCVLYAGEVNVIIGESGCGKTTLLRILMGLEQSDGGDLTEISSLRPAVVFQEDRLCDNLSAISNIQLVTGSSVSRNKVQSALAAMGLSDCWNKPVRQLSGGMRRRVALIRALLADYDILLLDEPFKGLDEQTKRMVIAYTQTSAKGKTVILVTHDKNEALQMQSANIISLATQCR